MATLSTICLDPVQRKTLSAIIAAHRHLLCHLDISVEELILEICKSVPLRWFHGIARRPELRRSVAIKGLSDNLAHAAELYRHQTVRDILLANPQRTFTSDGAWRKRKLVSWPARLMRAFRLGDFDVVFSIKDCLLNDALEKQLCKMCHFGRWVADRVAHIAMHSDVINNIPLLERAYGRPVLPLGSRVVTPLRDPRLQTWRSLPVSATAIRSHLRNPCQSLHVLIDGPVVSETLQELIPAGYATITDGRAMLKPLGVTIARTTSLGQSWYHLAPTK